MGLSFWKKIWHENHIPFHKTSVHPLLEKYLSHFSERKKMVFVPLCGKSLDMYYLYQLGYSVSGIEISDIAIEQFFIEQQLSHEKNVQNDFVKYSTDRLQLFCGDFFQFSNTLVSPIDIIYDRAALIAIPKKLRERYAEKIISLSNEATEMLLITVEYTDEYFEGPPFSVPEEEVYELYQHYFKIQQLSRDLIPHSVLRGQCFECAYRLVAARK